MTGLVIGISNTIFTAGLNSQLPEWVDKNILLQVNGYMSVISGLATVVGSLISGLIISFFGFHTVFATACLCYLVAAGLIVCVKTNSVTNTVNAVNLSFKMLKNITKLMPILKLSPVLVLMLITTLADTIGSGSHNVGFPIIAKLLSTHNIAATMGYILTLWAFGQIIGAKQLQCI